MIRILIIRIRLWVTLVLLIGAITAYAQQQEAGQARTIYTHAIGNWRNGPVVYITPLFETSEASTEAESKARFRARFAELDSIPDMDLDVLFFGTREEGEENRTSLRRKYSFRKLDVVMLGTAPKEEHRQP